LRVGLAERRRAGSDCARHEQLDGASCSGQGSQPLHTLTAQVQRHPGSDEDP
jgi:hypothetical protein